VILIVSNIGDDTATYFEETLKKSSDGYVRINTEDLAQCAITQHLPQCPSIDRFTINGRALALDAVTGVYYRRPGRPRLSVSQEFTRFEPWLRAELQHAWAGALAGLQHATWINRPHRVAAASYKIEQMTRAHGRGLLCPEAVVTQDPEVAEKFCRRHSWQVITKPLSHGELRGGPNEPDLLLYTSALRENTSSALERVREMPTLFQRRIEKACDVRVTIVHETCIAIRLLSQENVFSQIDCRREDMRDMRYERTTLPERLKDQLVALVRSYGLMFAAIDLIEDMAGGFWFLELNPGGQWAWLDEHVDGAISHALRAALLSESGVETAS
jgi:glutathione synthase/RimK-type ligase-like ATP-grasp enzyme